MMEKFSVLMSVYAREKGEYLRSSLNSIFTQSAPPDEVVLVEDGPLNDELYAVVEEFKTLRQELKVVRLLENRGSGYSRNQGLAVCSYDLVAIMDSDDICLEDRFKIQLQTFELNPKIDVAGSWVDEFSIDPSQIQSTRKLPKTPKEIAKFARSKCPINHPSVMFRKKAVLDAGGYLPFYLFEDYFLWARMLMGGAQFYNIQESLVLMRAGAGMFARRGGWKYAKSEIRLQRQFLKMGFIGYASFCKNLAIRFVVRMMPNKLRTIIYQKLLRK